MGMMLEMLVETEIPPEAAPAEFPPPILAESGGIFFSVVFWHLPWCGGRGSPYIISFRSRRKRGRKNRGDRTAEAPKRVLHAPRWGARGPCSKGPPGPELLLLRAQVGSRG